LRIGAFNIAQRRMAYGASAHFASRFSAAFRRCSSYIAHCASVLRVSIAHRSSRIAHRASTSRIVHQHRASCISAS
jgi:hypothetical protein